MTLKGPSSPNYSTFFFHILLKFYSQEQNAIYRFKPYMFIGQTAEERRKTDRASASNSKWVSTTWGKGKTPKTQG